MARLPEWARRTDGTIPPPMTDAPTLVDRAAYFEGTGTLVCADLHLGRAATADVAFPLGESDRLVDRIQGLLSQFDPDSVVFAGDVLHAFDRLPAGVEDTLARIDSLVGDAGARGIAVEGNHDTMLESLLDRTDAGIEPRSSYRIDEETLVCHGHEVPDGTATRYVVGHDHPAIEIEGKRRPCYLLGPHATGDGDVLVLPAFNGLAPGVPVNGVAQSDLQSPLLGPLGRYRPAVRDEAADETLWFPPLEDLREHL